MARIRTIKPEFWANDKLSDLPIETHAFAAGLLNHCDDEGYFNANPKSIGVTIFPVREEYRNSTAHIQELSNLGFINLYNATDGRVYGHVVNFLEHQVINKPKVSKIKDLITVPYEYGSSTVSVPSGKERKGKEHGKERNRELGTCAISAKSQNNDFEEFWNLYGYKIDKKKAEASYAKAIKTHTHETIIEGVKRYQEHIHQTGKQAFVKHPTTFLNSESFKNEYPQEINYAKPKSRQEKAIDAIEELRKELP